MKANKIKNNFFIKKKKKILSLKAFDVDHGLIKATGYIIMNKIAYISDCNKISDKDIRLMSNINFLIIDCLKRQTSFTF